MVAQITDTDIITTPVNVKFQTTLLRQARALCPYFAGTMASNLQQNQGTFTAKWRRYENVTPTTTPLTELNGNVSFPTRDSIVPTITDVTSQVLKYGQYFVVNEEVDTMRFDSEVAGLAKVLGISAGRSLNQLQRNEAEDNSTQKFTNGTATSEVNTVIDQNALRQAYNFLERQDAMPFTPMTQGSTNINTSPIRPAYWGLCHPDVELDIRDISGFIGVERYAGQIATEQGEFGTAEGIRFIASSDASINTGAGATSGTNVRNTTGNADVYDTVIYGEDAIGSLGFGMKHIQEVYRAGDELPAVQFIQKSRGSAGAADPLDELMTQGWKSWHAAKVLNANWTTNVQSAATDLTV
jgi:N4-gp56 family major capsid protein